AAVQPGLVLRPQAMAGGGKGDEIDHVTARVEELEQMRDGKLVAAGHRQGRPAVEEEDLEPAWRRLEPHRPGHAVVALERKAARRRQRGGGAHATPWSRVTSRTGTPAGRRSRIPGIGLPRMMSR